MANDGIGPVGGTRFGGGHGAPGYGGPTSGRPETTPHPPLDEVALTAPRRAALSLLRERVLEATRVQLELPARHPGIEFAAHPSDSVEVFVGRLLSGQNLLAAQRRDAWPEAAVASALENGLNDGLAETLEILDDVGELDVETWRLLCGVLEEFRRKVCAAIEASADGADHADRSDAAGRSDTAE